MKTTAISLLAALTVGFITPTMAQDRAKVEHELAIVAYNYAVGCSEREKYEEALEGLAHIPGGHLTELQQSWVDSLRTKCEIMVGHPAAAHEIPLAESELLDIDDQSAEFVRAIQAYRSGYYGAAKDFFTQVIELGDGPREQVRIEALFWRGQCQYQLGNWAECCKDLIAFNDTKNANTEIQYDALAYYTMGYARMHEKKWRHSRINFERYINRQPNKRLASYLDAEDRLKECKALEARSTTTYKQPLKMQYVETNLGEIIAITESLRKVDLQKSKEEEERAKAMEFWREWHAPRIQ
jgi:tetratricopeptide (TPR) repeat protein